MAKCSNTISELDIADCNETLERKKIYPQVGYKCELWISDFGFPLKLECVGIDPDTKELIWSGRMKDVTRLDQPK